MSTKCPYCEYIVPVIEFDEYDDPLINEENDIGGFYNFGILGTRDMESWNSYDIKKRAYLCGCPKCKKVFIEEEEYFG